MSFSPYLSDPDVTIYNGDALEVLRTLPDRSVHMCATSPPFYGLRDYGTGTWEGGDAEHEHDRRPARNGRGGSGSPGKQTEGSFPDDFPAAKCSCGAVYRDPQIGLEESPDEWVARLVEVFDEVKRVLRDDATLWLELGDFVRQQAASRTTLEACVRAPGKGVVPALRDYLGATTSQPHARVRHRPPDEGALDGVSALEAGSLLLRRRSDPRAASTRRPSRNDGSTGRRLHPAPQRGAVAGDRSQRPLRLDDPHRANPLRPLRHLAAEARTADDPGGDE